MIVVSLSNVPPRLKGFLTKYLWEISTGVYVGSVNVRIKDAIWDRICDNTENAGKAIMVFPATNEQGFDFQIIGSTWVPVDYEDLKLIMRPTEKKKDKVEELQNNKESDHRNNVKQSYVMIDLETTGLDSNRDEILEIGALRIRNGQLENTYERIIKTKVPEEICLLTGITQEEANEGITLKKALEELSEFINGDTVAGYNIRMFDLKFLKKAYSNYKM